MRRRRLLPYLGGVLWGSTLACEQVAVDRPHRLTDALMLLMQAVRRGDILRADFYTGRGILDVFDGESIHWRSGPPKLMGEVLGFTYVPVSTTGRLVFPGMSVFFAHEARERPGTPEARITLTILADGQATFSDIECIVGTNWVPDLSTPQHGPLLSEGPHGGERMVYTLPCGDQVARVYVQLGRVGDLRTLHVGTG